MNQTNITILAIESSCDDTSVAVINNGKVLSNLVAGQQVHEQYGGVVPELASRAHQQNILPLVDVAFKKAGISPAQLSAVAFTAGPGLIGSLMVGCSFAKGLALSLNLPLIKLFLIIIGYYSTLIIFTKRLKIWQTISHLKKELNKQ